jgi:SRSO17 transposase
MAGNEFILKTCPRVVRKLLRWMREKKLVDCTNDEIKDLCENQLWEDTVRDLGL